MSGSEKISGKDAWKNSGFYGIRTESQSDTCLAPPPADLRKNILGARWVSVVHEFV